MSQHPLNLGFRFVMELLLLLGLVLLGTELTQNEVMRVVTTITLPLIGVLLWGIFRVSGEGAPPLVAVSGRVRLALEVALFGGTIAGLVYVGNTGYAAFLAVLAPLYYALSYDRVIAMLRNAPLPTSVPK
jgi:hypothetical protein